MPPQPLRVFIVDDSPPVAEVLTELIASPGRIEVVGVGVTEQESIESILALAPDVVVLDLQLKAGSGTGVIKAVRAVPGLRGTKLMVTSNHTNPQLRQGCLQLGADGYFDKVKELSQLAAAVTALADQKARG